MGHSFSLEDCDHIEDIITCLGEPCEKEAKDNQYIIYKWKHYMVTFNQSNGQVITIEDRHYSSSK